MVHGTAHPCFRALHKGPAVSLAVVGFELEPSGLCRAFGAVCQGIFTPKEALGFCFFLLFPHL